MNCKPPIYTQIITTWKVKKTENEIVFQYRVTSVKGKKFCVLILSGKTNSWIEDQKSVTQQKGSPGYIQLWEGLAIPLYPVAGNPLLFLQLRDAFSIYSVFIFQGGAGDYARALGFSWLVSITNTTPPLYTSSTNKLIFFNEFCLRGCFFNRGTFARLRKLTLPLRKIIYPCIYTRWWVCVCMSG